MQCPPPGDLPNPGIEPTSPTLQADLLLSEPPGKPKCLSLLYFNLGMFWQFVLSRLSRVQLFAMPRTVDCSGSSVHRILQARILEWIAMPASRGSS